MALARILKIDRFERSSNAVRIKAIVLTACVVCAVQLIGLIVQTQTDGFEWAYAGPVFVSSLVLFLLTFSYRFHSRFFVAGVGFTLIFASMIYVVASVEKAGMNSSLIPYLPVAIILSGFISGWRMTLLAGMICLGVAGLLFLQTAAHTADGTLAAAFANRMLVEKVLQLGLACVMATVIAGAMSLFMHGLFKRDEDNIIKVQRAERQRTAFLSSLSHEIRTPLNGIIGMSALLKHTNVDPQQSQYTNMIHQCGENLLEVLGTVMEFNQINYDRIVLNEEMFDVHKLAHDLVKKYANRLPAGSDVIMGLHIAEQVPQYLYADKNRLETVINHILRNAVHFTPHGSINLLLNGSLIPDEKFRLSVYVRDTGVGIRKEQLEDIYKPFHQLDNELTREHEGTGLGLSLCKEIIRVMNGQLDVVSEFGVGSTFFFELDMPVKSVADIERKSNGLEQASDLSNVAIFKKTG